MKPSTQGKTAKIFILVFNAQFVINNKGAVIGTHGTAYNITLRKEKQKALVESYTEYRALFENMLSGFAYHRIVLDEPGKPVDCIFLEINTAFEKYTGLTRGIIGKKVTEVYPGIKKSDPDFIGIYGKVALTGEPAQFDVFFEPSQRWYSITAYCPKKGFFVAVFNDITITWQIEHALRASEARYRLIAENFPDGAVILFDHKLQLILAHGEILKKVGLTTEMMVGKPLTEVLPPDRTADLLPYYQAAFSGETHRFEYMYGGRIFDVFTLPVKTINKEIIAGMSISQDITKLKEDESRINQLLAEKDLLLKEVHHRGKSKRNITYLYFVIS